MRARKLSPVGAEIGGPPIAVRVAEACLLTGICRSKLYALNKAGTLRFRKIGSATVILYEDLRALIEQASSVDVQAVQISPRPVSTLSGDDARKTHCRVARSKRVARSHDLIPSHGVRQGSLFALL
jgi:excisionase family DNA binding protein